MEHLKLPDFLDALLYGQPYVVDDVGRSRSKVLLFSDKVLKIREQTEETDTEYEMLQWLDSRLPVPQMIYHRITDGIYLVMSRIEGEMACNEGIVSDPGQLTYFLADVLKKLWSVDISDCPVSRSLNRKLIAAKAVVDSGEVDVDDAEPDTFGESGFADPAELLEWLILNRPAEDLVLSHGDFCLPNILLKDGKLSGLIDLGRAGVADRWQDIALCYRSLKHNYAGKYGGEMYGNYDPDLLFTALGIEPDWSKLKYYTLLDELF